MELLPFLIESTLIITRFMLVPIHALSAWVGVRRGLVGFWTLKSSGLMCFGPDRDLNEKACKSDQR